MDVHKVVPLNSSNHVDGVQPEVFLLGHTHFVNHVVYQGRPPVSAADTISAGIPLIVDALNALLQLAESMSNKFTLTLE